MDYKATDYKTDYPVEIEDGYLMPASNSAISNVDSIIDEANFEGQEDFLDYVKDHGFIDERGIVVLSSSYHYFYTKEDLQNVKTVINLKLLNHEKDIKSFIGNLFNIIPTRSRLVGCFIDNDTNKSYPMDVPTNRLHSLDKEELVDNGIESKVSFFNRLIDFIDSRTNNYLNKQSVSRMLENGGFGIVDMTEINGVTYFCAQKVQVYA